MKISEKYNLEPEEIDRIIEMAWEDRTPFEAIWFQYELSEVDVITLMRQELTKKSWKKWRERVQGRATKHRKLRTFTEGIFRSSRQKAISTNSISKRHSRR
ncbi:TIGR03643 family protein [Marinoscillum furvescens]|uniref:Uncharacterized protein (TIGR03643 family) n=1 Tax=Marinoscillum furvescens DSM 4134 TaxID=1122208 RepID=A0A3D9L590_MARFU|nr:TIGR03643 family protein [Marinoscillum furvescens]RED99564.1 uncharacterized protein (TIGR03643 family) [Marinoscillum furvescens DSM 4134]